MVEKSKYIHKLEDNLFKDMIESVSLNKDLAQSFSSYEEKIRRPDLLGKTLQVTKNQLGHIYEIIEELCGILEIDIPQIFAYEDFCYGVESKGVDKYWLEISVKTIVDFTKEELRFLIARELCSIKLKHTYYQTLIDEYMTMMDQCKFVIGADEKSKISKAIMYKWSRVSNYTEDNFGLLVCKDIEVCSKAILKLILNNRYLVENIDISEYIKQTEEINKLNDDIYNYTKADERIPYGPYRIKNLLAYASSSRFIENY